MLPKYVVTYQMKGVLETANNIAVWMENVSLQLRSRRFRAVSDYIKIIRKNIFSGQLSISFGQIRYLA